VAEMTWQAILEMHDPKTILLYPHSEATCTIIKFFKQTRFHINKCMSTSFRGNDSKLWCT